MARFFIDPICWNPTWRGKRTKIRTSDGAFIYDASSNAEAIKLERIFNEIYELGQREAAK